MHTAEKVNKREAEIEVGDGDKKGTLTRQEIALALHSKLGNISHREAKRLTDSVIDEIVETLTSGKSLKLHDFGTFVVRSKHERAGRNPRTGAPVPIEARRVIVFKASPNMKAAVNGDRALTREKKRSPRRNKASGAAPGAHEDKSARAREETLAG